MNKTIDSFEYLIEAAKLLNSTFDFHKLLAQAVQLTSQALHCEASCLFLYDSKRTRLDKELNRFFSWKRNARSHYPKAICQQLADYVMKQQAPLVANHPDEYRAHITYGHEPKQRSIHSIISVPLKRRHSTLGVIQAMNRLESEHFSPGDLTILQVIADLIAIAIDNTRLYRKLKRESKQKNILFELGKKVSSSLDLSVVLDSILDSLREAVDYDAAGIYLVQPGTQNIKHYIIKGFDPSAEAKLDLKIGDGVIGWAIKTGRASIVPDVSLNVHYVKTRRQTRAELVVPIYNGQAVAIGAFNVESDRLDAYQESDLKLLQAFSTQVAVSIEMATLHKELLEKKHLEEELSIARRIQASFLPQQDPTIPGFDVSGMNIPSEEVSGDYYDFVKITERDWGIIVSDVAGKGIPASLIMASFRAALLAQIENNYSIGLILEKVNNMLYKSTEGSKFVTSIYGVLDSEQRVLTYANAGHNYPLLLHQDGRCETPSFGGFPLGLFSSPQAEYTESRLQLQSGDILVLYTDGVVETYCPRLGEFGLGKLKAVVEKNRRLTAVAIREAIYAAVKEFRKEEPQRDDITIVVIKAL
ncbi:MAG: SpoIIE family protein phosphatase [Acidobacteria bacterium]|nr:SpoIIE family protein phosphatase [Acidobacteriota bacterium]